MPFNLQIPGEVTPQELQAITEIARTVPPNGIVVEVGSFMGRSSWCWAKSVDPSVTVYCIDPWQRYRNAKDDGTYERTEYSLETFQHYVRDCPNLVPLQGYSPRDFADWDKPIDVYFEDAVHKNPILRENIEFWSRHLKPTGLACGHDYITKFPDVIQEAQALAKRRDCVVKVVRSLWCLLPRELAKAPSAIRTLSRELNAIQAHGIKDFSAAFEIEAPVTELKKGQPLIVRGTVHNPTDRAWPILVDGEHKLKVGLRVLRPGLARPLISATHDLAGSEFMPGATLPFSFEAETSWLPVGDLVIELDLLYEYAFRFSARGGKPFTQKLDVRPPLVFTSVNRELPVENEASWKQYCPELNPTTPLPLQCLAKQDYEVPTERGRIAVRSMLTQYEIALLYALARDYYKGEGAIVDLGPLLGLSTYAFAKGLLDNLHGADPRKRIYSFDLFLLDRMDHFLPAGDGGSTGSVFDRYLAINQDHLDQIVVSPGDFMKMGWDGQPVELLFIDMAKSPALNRAVMQRFFGALIPGRSIVIQQDYAHSGEYWIPITMELLADYFEPLHYVIGATATFRCTKAIPPDALALDVGQLPLERQLALLERAAARVGGGVGEVLKTSRAMCLHRHQRHDEALRVLAEVDPTKRSASHTADFSLIARGSVDHLRRLIATATGK